MRCWIQRRNWGEQIFTFKNSSTILLSVWAYLVIHSIHWQKGQKQHVQCSLQILVPLMKIIFLFYYFRIRKHQRFFPHCDVCIARNEIYITFCISSSTFSGFGSVVNEPLSASCRRANSKTFKQNVGRYSITTLIFLLILTSNVIETYFWLHN